MASVVLIHLTRNGYPVGIHAENGTAFYFPEDRHHEAYGKAVVSKKGEEITWPQWCASLAKQSVNPRALWDIKIARGRTLSQILRSAQEDSLYGR